MDIQIKRGLIEVLALASLREGDSYGYEMIKKVSACMEISESTLYPVLKRLEAVEALTTYTKEHNGRLRKYYSITETGRAKIAAFMEEWKQVEKVLEFIKEGTKGE